ncbi:hypothetical protein [Nocardia seriolae]|uniref:DUF11 domain-containing protein n=1 Tax=Nocardia seriolae TaxID=37332 RepID=A0ABC9YLY1_9NOCA|nr:hypothetical protein [Nocardia seriolae]BEK92137.1 hypothetical protein NSER024013_00430 [Nocardia seriolae]GAM44418.1 hypothetical protein NS07_v2contig00004-0033 [Nocardia seriolae]GAP26437.1 hypothetical protein NSK11_contig00006-0033 [Nocardia seriolae]
MFRNRRAAAIISAAAMVSAGLSVTTLETGISSADTTCAISSHAEKKDVSTLGITMTYDKSANLDSIGVGTTVTYKIVIGTTGIGNPYVNTITDFPPSGFAAPAKATVTAFHVVGGQRTEDVTPEPNAGGWKVTNPGWFVNSGNPLTYTITYPVPTNLSAGQHVTSGGVGVAGTVGVSNEMPNLTACFTARANTAGEDLLGSLGNNGLGSADGQLSSTGSLSTILSDAIRKYIGS